MLSWQGVVGPGGVRLALGDGPARKLILLILLIPWAFPPGVLSISEGIVLGVVLEGGLRLLPNPLLQTSTRFCNGCAWPPSGAELIRAPYREELGRVYCIL